MVPLPVVDVRASLPALRGRWAIENGPILVSQSYQFETMPRVRIATVALSGLSFVFLAAAAACEFEYRQYPVQLAGLTPLRVSMATSEPVRASFTAVWSERHYLALVFPPNVDLETAALLTQAASTVGATRAEIVRFDFDWRVRENAIEVARGSGRAHPTGAFGSGERGLQFGEFPAVAGRTYAVEATPGASFQAWTRASPSIEVGVNSAGPSVGLPWVKEFSRPIAIILASFRADVFGWRHLDDFRR